MASATTLPSRYTNFCNGANFPSICLNARTKRASFLLREKTKKANLNVGFFAPRECPQSAVRTCLGGEDRLDRFEEHHHHHHDGKNGDGISRHPHHKQIHRHLFDGSEGNVPWSLEWSGRLVSCKVKDETHWQIDWLTDKAVPKLRHWLIDWLCGCPGWFSFREHHDDIHTQRLNIPWIFEKIPEKYFTLTIRSVLSAPLVWSSEEKAILGL